MSRKTSLIIVLFGILSTILIAYLDEFGTDSIGLIQILLIDLFTAILLFILLKYKFFSYKFNFFAMLSVNFLFFLNVSGWNTGGMEGRTYIIQLLQPATDMLYWIIFFSAFLLGIPIILYIIFLFALSQLFCHISNKS